MTAPVVGFAGMTHLGLCSAAAFAARGLETVGFDPDAALIRRIAGGDLPVSEPGLEGLIGSDRLTFTSDPGKLGGCDIVYVAADVPTDANGAGDLAPIAALIETVLPVLRDGATLVVLSQVPPGFTRALPLPPARLFCQVETLVFGEAVARAREPERIIVGCARPDAPLPDAYRAALDAFDCPVLRIRYESAELAKIAINLCLAASVSVANSLAELSERIGADWDEIAPALRLDRRIGPHAYLTPGLGISGGNLERDLATARALAERHGADAGVVAAFLANSARRKAWPVETLAREGFGASTTARIGLLGLAYKADTASVRNAPSLALIEALPHARITAYDPEVPADAVACASRAADALAAAEGAEAVAILTPWPAFRAIPPDALAARMAGSVVIDPYRMLDREAARAAGLRHIVLGLGEPA